MLLILLFYYFGAIGIASWRGHDSTLIPLISFKFYLVMLEMFIGLILLLSFLSLIILLIYY